MISSNLTAFWNRILMTDENIIIKIDTITFQLQRNSWKYFHEIWNESIL